MDWTLVPVILLALIAAVFALNSIPDFARETAYSSTQQGNNTENKDYGRKQQNYGFNRVEVQDEEVDSMLMASAGRSRKNSKSKRGDDDDDDEDKKTLSQQIADGKYGLIEKEIYATTPDRPGIISYASNPEVPRDNAKNLGGLEPEEIWLAENHVLVLRGGYFPEHKFNRSDETATAWPPIDPYNAPPRQVKIPSHPKVPPPFPVQLADNGPTQFIGFNGTAGPPPFPPFFPQPPPGNGSYFAPPFPFPPPPGNFTPGGGFYPPPGNGSFYSPPFPFPLPPRNGSFFVPPPGNFTPGSGPFYPPPFPGLPPNSTIRPPPPFLQNLPPGAAFLPPPGNLTIPFDEDDPSIYYPPPYDFYYPQDNSTEVPPGPLVPGIILPPPPNFFAPLEEQTTQQPIPPPPPHRTYLPGSKDGRPSAAYLPVTSDVQMKKPSAVVDSTYNQVTTPVPNLIEPPRPPININVQVTHQGSSQAQEPGVIVTQSYYTSPVTDIVLQPHQSPPQLSKQHQIPPQRQKTRPVTTSSPLVIFYNSQQSQGIETNTVTPTPQPYYVKSQGVTATLSPVVYYTVPSAGNVNEPTSVKTSFYFYEEPHEKATTQATPLTFDKPSQQHSTDSPTPNSARGRKTRPQYEYPPGNTATDISYKEGLQSEAPPTQQPSKVSVSPQPYVYSDVIPVEQVKNIRQRTRTQQYLVPPVLPIGQQVIYSNGPNIQYPSPQYYYVTARPSLQYNILGSSTPQQSYVKSTPQPVVSNLAYFTTPRPDVAYQNIISTQRQVLYSTQPSSSPRPIYQYSFESKQNPTHEPLGQNVYTTSRPKSRLSQRVNYQSNTEGSVALPVQYQTTPRTLFEYSYQQRVSTAVPQVGYYSVPQYNQEVTAGSPATHYGYDESGKQNQQSQSYRNSQVNIYPTSNPLHSYFTKQDETLLDDITKKYFTIFGQKLQAVNEEGPTTPIPPYTHKNAAKTDGQYYTTPSPKYNSETSGRPSEAALADDINVNYQRPLPAINPFSEYIDTRQSSDSETGGALVSYKFPGDGGHFYFITPQIVGAQSQQSLTGYVYSLPAEQPELGVRYRRRKRKEQR